MKSLSRRGLVIGSAIGLLAAPRIARAAGPLVLYNGQHRPTTEAIVKAFTERTGHAVTVRQGESSALSNQLVEEGANSPADLFFSEQSPPIAALDEKGMLLPAGAEALGAVPAGYVSARKTWVGVTMRSRVVAYNKAAVPVAELPRSILDVATSAWAGKVGYVIRDGFPEQVMAIAKEKGPEAALAWLRGLKAGGKLYNGNGAAMRAVEAGEIPIALVNNYYWFGVAKEKGADAMQSALHYMPKTDPGALINLSPAAVLKTSKSPEIAGALLAFMVSPEGQNAAVSAFAEYPVRAGITSPFALKPLSEIEGSVTPADVGDAAPAYRMMREVGML